MCFFFFFLLSLRLFVSVSLTRSQIDYYISFHPFPAENFPSYHGIVIDPQVEITFPLPFFFLFVPSYSESVLVAI